MIPAGVSNVTQRIRRILDKKPGGAPLNLAQEALTLHDIAREAIEDGNAVRAQIVRSIAREFEDRAYGLRQEAA